jgi:hypothetical protein
VISLCLGGGDQTSIERREKGKDEKHTGMIYRFPGVALQKCNTMQPPC